MTRESRRAHIIEAAEGLFVDQGYAQTTMDGIAEAAGMSKRTLYGIFPDKREIFVEVVNFQNSVPPLPHLRPEAEAGTALKDMLVHIAEFILEPRRISLARLAISEARTMPDVTENFFDNGYNVLTALAVGRIELLIARKLIKPIDAKMTADLLIGAMLGDTLVRYLGFPDKASGLGRENLSRRADAAVAMMTEGLCLTRT